MLAAWMVLMPLAIEFKQTAKVVGAVRQALGREVVDRVVEGRIDPLAGGKLGLGGGDQVGGLLQLKQIGPDACRKNDFTHAQLRYEGTTRSGRAG